MVANVKAKNKKLEKSYVLPLMIVYAPILDTYNSLYTYSRCLIHYLITQTFHPP
jgi:hypothetical protein